MKILNMRIAIAALTFGLIGMSQVAFAEMRDLTKDEIIEIFSDKTVWGDSAKKGGRVVKRNMVYFAPDGTFIGKRLDERNRAEGEWYVNDEDLLCMKNDNGQEKCLRVVDKNGKIRKYNNYTHVWNFSKFKDGNCIEKC